jgi:hypothetical protein
MDGTRISANHFEKDKNYKRQNEGGPRQIEELYRCQKKTF